MSSIKITQDPTYLNVSKNPMVFVVSGSNTDEFQYQYVLDVRTFPDNTLRTRIKQFPNPSGVAVFDVSHIVDDYIQYNEDDFKLTQIKSPLGEEFRRFQILAASIRRRRPSASKSGCASTQSSKRDSTRPQKSRYAL